METWAIICGEKMRAKGIPCALPRGCFDNGFQQLSSAVKPIHTVVDLEGVKMRTPNTAIYIELFQTLGAMPVPINLDKLYDSLKAGIVDAQTDHLAVIELFKLYEVQKYISITNHIWGGFNQIASLKKWQSLPADVQATIERNVAKYVKIQRKENAALNDHLRATLTQQGMTFNEAANRFRFVQSWGPSILAGRKRWAGERGACLRGTCGEAWVDDWRDALRAQTASVSKFLTTNHRKSKHRFHPLPSALTLSVNRIREGDAVGPLTAGGMGWGRRLCASTPAASAGRGLDPPTGPEARTADIASTGPGRDAARFSSRRQARD